MLTRMTSFLVLSLFTLALLPGCSDQATAPKPNPGATATTAPGAASPVSPASLASRIDDGVDRAIKVIRSYQDPKTGAVGFAQQVDEKTRHPGITAMALLAYMGSHRKYTADDGPFVRNALDWLASLQKPDGGIFERDSVAYVTSVALQALVVSGEARFAPQVEKARDFLVRTQSNEESGYRRGDKFFGGVGYGGDERPDLSNTQFALEAVKAAGLPAGDPFYANAIVFLQRTQNWSETNDLVTKGPDGVEIRSGNDGGAYYMPGESKAGIEQLPDGTRVFRSYGSMSYALLKSYLFCDLDRNDPRVRAVVRWCGEHLDFDRHPGFEPGEKGDGEYQGLFYYYFSVARALGTLRQRELEDGSGVKRDWARELAQKLLAIQHEDGSFANERNGRWMESATILCTLYATLALEECRAALARP